MSSFTNTGGGLLFVCTQNTTARPFVLCSFQAENARGSALTSIYFEGASFVFYTVDMARYVAGFIGLLRCSLGFSFKWDW